MAYARRSLKRKTTKKRTAVKRKAPKARKTSRGVKAPKVAAHRMTGYCQALLDPIKGPLVGIPTFVPQDTHRVRCRAIGDISSQSNTRIYFNPRRMLSKSFPSVLYKNNADVANISNDTNLFGAASSNVQYQATDFQIMTEANFNANTIDNGDGIRGRVVAALFRVCNTSSANTRSGTFTALHEKHHKTLEDFTSSELKSDMDSIIKPAADGSYINLLYRPVKPEEIEDWQSSPLGYHNEFNLSGDVQFDGTLVDQFPGFMCVEYNGVAGQSLHIEAYAICEYVGESLTTLSRPGHLGGGVKATVEQIGPSTKDAKKKEEGTLVDLEPSLDEKHTKLRETLTVLKGVAQNYGTVAHIEDKAMHEYAHIADLAYTSHANGGDLDPINDHVQSLPDYVDRVKGFDAIHASEDGMNVVLRNPDTGEVVVSFAGTVHDSIAGAHEHWTVNNHAIWKGKDVFRNTERYQDANSLIRDTIEEFGRDNVHLVGHSQGGAVAIIGSAEHGVPATVFNPGVPHDFAAGEAHVTVYRNPGDIVSTNAILGSHGAPDIAGGNFTVKTIPFKEGTINERSILGTMLKSHEMDQFTALDEGVTVVSKDLVAVSRLTQAASAIGVLGAAVATYDTAKESVHDWKVDLAEHGAVLGSVEATGDTAINVSKGLVDWTAVGATMTTAAEIGEAIFPPGGALIGAAVGAAVGFVETMGIDKVASGMKRLWHKVF